MALVHLAKEMGGGVRDLTKLKRENCCAALWFLLRRTKHRDHSSTCAHDTTRHHVRPGALSRDLATKAPPPSRGRHSVRSIARSDTSRAVRAWWGGGERRGGGEGIHKKGAVVRRERG
eukprot:2561210-Pleurochrysis_carterae.AAC.1